MSTFTTATPVDFDPATDVVQGHRSGAAPVRPFLVATPAQGALADSALQPDDTRLAPAGIFFVDGTRTDTYTANGTTARPYKTFASLVARWSEVAGPITVIAAPATYSAGDSYTVPNYPLVLFANGGTLTSGGTLTVQNAFTAYDLNTTGNVVVGASCDYVRNRGTLDGNLSIYGNCDLCGVDVTGEITVYAGGTLTYDDSSSFDLGSLVNNGTVNHPVTQTQITASLAQEEAARLAADVALITGRRFFGGYSSFAAEAARAGFTRYGATLRLGPFYASGACVPVQVGGLVVSLTDADATSARVQVALTHGGGTATVRTTSRAWPLNVWRTLHVVVDAPVAGLLSAASLHVYIDGAAVTLETVADASGAPLTAASAWYLGADSAGANTLSGVISRYGWSVYNYPMSAAQVVAWHSLGNTPIAGAGTMQFLTNGNFDKFTGTADDGTTDSFFGWSNTFGDANGRIEAVSDAIVAGKACKITVGANVFTYLSTKLPSGSKCIVTIRTRGDGTNAGQWAVVSPALSAYVYDTAGMGRISTGVAGANWTTLSRMFEIPSTVTDAELRLYGGTTVGSVSYFAEVSVYIQGNLIEGLDLAAQPVCSRTALGAVLYDSATGVAPRPDVRPIQMQVPTPVSLTDSSYLIGDRLVHPAGYKVTSVDIINSGSVAVTATVRAGSSSGTTIATGSIAGGGATIPLSISSSTALTAAGGKIHITGATTASPLSATVTLQRT